MSFTSNINDMVERAISDVRNTANDLPPTHSAFQPVITWIVALVNALIAALELILRAVDSKADALHDEINLVETHVVNHAREAVNAAVQSHPQLPSIVAATAGSSTTSQQRTSAPRRSKCTKCHARGHDVTQCRTANPSAMRKRVARNNRTAKQARLPRPDPPVIPMPPPSPYHPSIHYSPPPFAMHSMEYAAIAADSSELRRRAAQSARDKRRRKKDAAAPPS